MSRGLVSIVTCSRALCHELSCQMLRAGEVVLGGVEMPLRDVHRPSTASTSAAIDIVIGRCAWHVMVAATRRKTRIPTGDDTSSTQVKPPAAATAFCVLSSPYIILGACGICHCPADFPAAVTPTANRNSYRVAILFFYQYPG